MWSSTSVPSSLCKIGLTPEPCGSCWSAQTDQQVYHGSKEGNAPSLVQSRQWNGDEIKEGKKSQRNLDIRHNESGLDHPLGHRGEYRFHPGIQGRSEKETGSDISRDGLKRCVSAERPSGLEAAYEATVVELDSGGVLQDVAPPQI